MWIYTGLGADNLPAAMGPPGTGWSFLPLAWALVDSRVPGRPALGLWPSRWPSASHQQEPAWPCPAPRPASELTRLLGTGTATWAAQGVSTCSTHGVETIAFSHTASASQGGEDPADGECGPGRGPLAPLVTNPCHWHPESARVRPAVWNDALSADLRRRGPSCRRARAAGLQRGRVTSPGSS